MTEEVRLDPDCRNASNPFHQCSNYCFKLIYESKKRLNTGGTGMTKVKHDGFDLGDQSGNLVDQSTLLASNNDEDNIVGDFTNLTKLQKKMLRQNEAIKAHRTAMVQEKNIMEPPEESGGFAKQKNQIGRLSDSNGLDTSKADIVHKEEMAQEKHPASAGRDGEKFVNDFLTAFPPLTYLGDKGGEEIFAPPIPVKADINAQINTEDVSKVGAYPDHVVRSIANERDTLKAQLQQAMEETIKQKMLYQNQRRQAELWRAKYKEIANVPVHGPPVNHGQEF